MSIFPSVKLFWLSCIMLEKLGWLIYSGSFTVRGCFTLIWNDSINHMHFRAAYVKDILPFARTYTEKSVDSYLCFRLVLLHSVSYFVFPYQSPSSPLCKIFDAFSSNINEVLSIKPSANVSVFGGFNVHHKDLLTYPGELCYNFLTLLKWLTFLIGSLTVTITVLLFCIYLFIYLLWS